MDPGVIGVFIPIVAIVMGIGIGMLSIWSEHKRKAQLLEQNHRERMHAIEKGIELPPLPPNLVGFGSSPGPSTTNAARSLRSGIMLVLIGIVLFFAIVAVGAERAALFGLIPTAVGIANLVYAAILWKKEQIGTSLPVERR
jgi:preprotein translocase subunit YajC